MAGKGDKRRPSQVSNEVSSQNWNDIDWRKPHEKLADFLGEEGIKFFKDLYEEHGDLNVVLPIETDFVGEKAFPHAVHFNEGMQIRNWMRQQREFQKYLKNDHYFDDNWIELTLKAIGVNE